MSRHRSADTQCSRRRTDHTWYVRSAKCTRVEVQSAQEWKCKVHNSILQTIENAATTTNQPLSHQLSLENRRVSDRLRRQGESDEQRQQRLGARRASRRLESHDQHEQRLQNKRVSDRLRRDQESQEEHDQRLQRRRERDALARQEESQEQHEQRLERSRVSDRLRRHQESNEQRLQNSRESVRTRRQQQTVEHQQHNLALRRFRHKTVEQFLADLKIPLDCCCVCQRLVYSDKTKKMSSTILAEVDPSPYSTDIWTASCRDINLFKRLPCSYCSKYDHVTFGDVTTFVVCGLSLFPLMLIAL